MTEKSVTVTASMALAWPFDSQARHLPENLKKSSSQTAHSGPWWPGVQAASPEKGPAMQEPGSRHVTKSTAVQEAHDCHSGIGK